MGFVVDQTPATGAAAIFNLLTTALAVVDGKARSRANRERMCTSILNEPHGTVGAGGNGGDGLIVVIEW